MAGRGLLVKNPSANARDPGPIPGLRQSPGEKMAAHSSVRAWEIPWPEEPWGLQSTGSQTVRHDWVTKQQNNFTSLSGKESWLQHQLHRLPARIKWDYIFSESCTMQQGEGGEWGLWSSAHGQIYLGGLFNCPATGPHQEEVKLIVELATYDFYNWHHRCPTLFLADSKHSTLVAAGRMEVLLSLSCKSRKTGLLPVLVPAKEQDLTHHRCSVNLLI